MLKEDRTEITDEDITHILTRPSENEQITHVTRGGGGIIMSLNKINGSHYPFVINRSNYANRNINSLLLKFVFITETDRDFKDYNTSNSHEFLHELEMQRQIFRASSDKYLEPLVPQLLFAAIYGTGENPYHYLSALLQTKIRGDEDADTIQSLQYIIDICTTKRSVSIGLIVMENMSDFQTAYSFFRDNRIITPDDSRYRYDFDNGDDFYHNKYFYYMLFTIYQLALLGYVHGDIHLGNLIINPNYTYFHGYQGVVKLIDFGRTKFVGRPTIGPDLDLNIFKIEWHESVYDRYTSIFTGYNWYRFPNDPRLISKIQDSLMDLSVRRFEARRLFDEHVATSDAIVTRRDEEKDEGKMDITGGTKNVYDKFDPEFIFTTRFIMNYVKETNVFLDKLIQNFKSKPTISLSPNNIYIKTPFASSRITMRIKKRKSKSKTRNNNKIKNKRKGKTKHYNKIMYHL